MEKKSIVVLFLILPLLAFAVSVRGQSETSVKFPTIAEEKLAIASRYGDYETVKQLLSEGVSPNSRDRFNQPAILLALRLDKNKTYLQIKDTLDLLIEAGADVNVKNEFGVTPYYAAKVREYLYKDEDFADYLVQKGATPQERDIHGRSPFSHFHNLQKSETPFEQLMRFLIEGYEFQVGKYEASVGGRFLFNNATFPMALVYYDQTENISSACNLQEKPLEQRDLNGENIYFYAARNYRSLLDFLGCFSSANFSGGEAEIIELIEKLNNTTDFEIFRKMHNKYLKFKNKQGETALDIAYKMNSNFFAAYYYLLENKPDEFDAEGLTPIFQAIKHKNYLAIGFLKGFLDTNLNLKLKDGTTPLISAVKTGDEMTVLMLTRGLKQGEYDAFIQKVEIKTKNVEMDLADNAGKTPLMWAAEKGFSKIVKILLRNGADPNKKSKSGETALSLAKAKRHSSIAYRLENLANPVKREKDNKLSDDKTKSRQAIAKKDLDKPDAEGKTPLMNAAENGNVGVINALISTGAKIDAVDVQGRTALFYAVSKDEVYAVKALLEKGANVNHIARKNVTPLMVAARYSFDLLIPILLDAGAKIDVQDSNEMSALMWAVKEADMETVEAVLLGKPNLRLKNSDNRTVTTQMMYQNGLYEEDVFKLLLKNGADPNEITQFRNYDLPILHTAIANKRYEFLIPLLKAGANPYVQDIFETDAYQYVWMFRCIDCEKIIDKYKLDKYKPQEKIKQ